jgi:subtilisin family serine protease
MSPRRFFVARVSGIVMSAALLVSSVFPSSVSAQASAASGSTSGVIVTVRDRDDIDDVVRAARRLGVSRFEIFRYAVGGFATDLTASQMTALVRDPRVKRISPNLPVRKRTVETADVVAATSMVQPGAPYQLDRIDQPYLPLDGTYTAPNAADGVSIYMIDTGVRATHIELAGRVTPGVDVVGADASGQPSTPTGDCDGHGTHTAALAAGTSFGVAKLATIVAVRVLDCYGNGDIEGVIKGIDWVIRHHRGGTLAVANMSLGVAADRDSDPLDDAVRDLITDGIVPVVAAGNSNEDACGTSPGHVREALNVGATSANDDRFFYSAGGSNYGACLDMFAPGVRVLSASAGNDTDTHYESGTSMASPLVAGYAAMIAKVHPVACPASVIDAIIERGVRDVVYNAGPGSPNVMLNVSNVAGVAQSKPGTPSALVATPSTGGITVSWDPGCSGGFDNVTSTVRVYVVGKDAPIRTMTMKSTDRISVSGLDPARSYRVSVRRKNAVGAGAWSEKSVAMSPSAVKAGAQVKTAGLAVSTEANVAGQWSVKATSAGVCRTLNGNARLYALRKGKCAVLVTPRYTDVPFSRTFNFVETTAPANSGSGERFVYKVASKRLYAIDANNRVVRSLAVVAPVNPPSVGRYKLSKGDVPSSFVAKRSGDTLRFAPFVTSCDPTAVCDAVYPLSALGTVVSPEGVYLPPGDARWFTGRVGGTSVLNVVR